MLVRPAAWAAVVCATALSHCSCCDVLRLSGPLSPASRCSIPMPPWGPCPGPAGCAVAAKPASASTAAAAIAAKRYLLTADVRAFMSFLLSSEMSCRVVAAFFRIPSGFAQRDTSNGIVHASFDAASHSLQPDVAPAPLTLQLLTAPARRNAATTL